MEGVLLLLGVSVLVSKNLSSIKIQNRSVGIVTDTERNEIVSKEKCRGVSNGKSGGGRSVSVLVSKNLSSIKIQNRSVGIVTDTPFPEKQGRGANVKTRKSRKKGIRSGSLCSCDPPDRT